MKLKLQTDPSKIFVCGDTHFSHTNIIRYDGRPFKDVEEHDEELIRRWNEVVPSDGVVIHVGDVFFCKTERALWILHRLNGEIHLTLGNHDKAIKGKIRERFTSVSDYLEVKVAGSDRLIVVSHYPFQVWNKSHYGSFHLRGHSHGSLPDPDHMLRLDVGVNSHNYYPWSLEEIKEYMSKKTWKPIDHHSSKKGR